jgi:hypothetical protein
MAFFDDFANAVTSYPVTSVTLDIPHSNVVLAQGTPTAVNVNEGWQFQVKVTNNGHLNLANVMLHIEGMNGATVGQKDFFGGIAFSAETFVDLPAINAHSSLDAPPVFFRAPSVPQPETVLVRAHISGIRTFAVNLDHILNGHGAHSDPPAATFSAQVFP